MLKSADEIYKQLNNSFNPRNKYYFLLKNNDKLRELVLDVIQTSDKDNESTDSENQNNP